MYFLIDCYAADSNGLEEYTRPFSLTLSKYTKVIRIGNRNGKLNNYKVYFPISENLPNGYARKLIRAIEYILAGIFVWIKIITFKPVYVHFQWFLLPWFDLILVQSIRKFSNTKIIFTAHNVVSHNKKDSHYLKSLLSKVDLTLVHSEILKSQYCNLYNIPKSKVFSLMHGKKESFEIDTSQIRIEPNEDGYVLFAGLINPNKGILRLLKSWNNLDINKKLIVLGKVNDKSILDYMSSIKPKNVTIINNFVNKHEFQNFIHKSLCIVLPYYHGSVSGVLFSAGISKKSVLATNFGGISEYIIHGETGLIANDWNEFCDHLKNLDKYDFEKMGDQSYLHFNLNFNWEKLVERYVQHLQ